MQDLSLAVGQTSDRRLGGSYLLLEKMEAVPGGGRVAGRLTGTRPAFDPPVALRRRHDAPESRPRDTGRRFLASEQSPVAKAEHRSPGHDQVVEEGEFELRGDFADPRRRFDVALARPGAARRMVVRQDEAARAQLERPRQQM